MILQKQIPKMVFFSTFGGHVVTLTFDPKPISASLFKGALQTSLIKIHQCTLHILWKQILKVAPYFSIFFAKLDMLWPWSLSFWPRNIITSFLSQDVRLISLVRIHQCTSSNTPPKWYFSIFGDFGHVHLWLSSSLVVFLGSLVDSCRWLLGWGLPRQLSGYAVALLHMPNDFSYIDHDWGGTHFHLDDLLISSGSLSRF